MSTLSDENWSYCFGFPVEPASDLDGRKRFVDYRVFNCGGISYLFVGASVAVYRLWVKSSLFVKNQNKMHKFSFRSACCSV